LNILVEVPDDEAWRAGVNYVEAIFYALLRTYDNVTLYQLRRGNQSHPSELTSLQRDMKVIRISRNRTSRLIAFAATRLFSCDIALACKLKEHNIDAVFGLLLSDQYPGIAKLSWIPDFQHVRLPEMFSLQEIDNRNRKYLKTAKISDRVILMSESTRRDFELFAPPYASKARVVSPVICPPESTWEKDPQSVIRKYNLPEKFLYLPGRFWKHKNHQIVFRALGLLKERGVRVCVVCDGYPGDHRHPMHFATLLTDLSLFGLRDQVILLCSTARDDIFSLMRQSICVVNPSLFEGYGLTISEAISVGKRALLSDIPPHREQNPPASTFFDPYDPEDLAGKMDEIWEQAYPGPDSVLEQQARHKLPERIRESGQSIMSVMLELIG
jgi:glycosyltransferase involved in cell wall biosynthesis